MAEISERFKTVRAELEARGTIENGLSSGRIDLLGWAEVEKLVAEWWGSREPVRKLQLDEFTDRRDPLAAIGEEAALLAERPEGDVAMRLADQLLVKAGAAAYPRRVGTMRTASSTRRWTGQRSRTDTSVRLSFVLRAGV